MHLIGKKIVGSNNNQYTLFLLAMVFSFDKGFRVQFSIFSEIGFENWQFQPSVAYKSVAYKKERIFSLIKPFFAHA